MLSFYLQMVETPEEKSAVEFLYTEYRRLMYKTAFSVLHNQQDSEDAVHEAFIRVINNISKIRDVRCHETKLFLVIIVRNAAINIYNANKKSSHVLIDDVEEMLQSDDSVEDTFFDKYDVELIEKMLLRLSENDYEVLFLSIVQSLKPSEIAAFLMLSPNTVSQRLHRAKIRLKQLVEKEYGGNYDKIK